jgi:malonate-semialdehyde dehydrogenase (acetylating)/methylmalonate-semialdehyde dehydrogenase
VPVTPTITINNFIGGRRELPRDANLLDVLDPATGEALAAVPLSGASDVDAAVRAARTAFAEWRDVPVPARARVMFRLQALVSEQLEELAELVTRENGKAIGEARGEVRRGLEVIEFACGMPTLMAGEVAEQAAGGVDIELVRQPVGVCAGITPFNFPAMIPLWMAPLAITAGNTFVLKPSERTPLTGDRLAELFVEAGVPAGVLNVVHGGREVVDALLAHPGVDAVSFVGSAPVARHVYETAAASGKRVQALAGAKNHMIVLPDADLDAAVPSLFASAFSNAGERCLAGSVVVPVGEVAEPLVERLVAAARSATVGSGLDGCDITPVTTPAALARITGYIERGLDEGAALVHDGRDVAAERGFFLAPSIFDHVSPDMQIAREEIFGPVLCVVRAGSLDEAIEIANRSRFGNAACIYTRSGAAVRRFRREIEAGMLGVNLGVPAPMAFMPFAGWKGSFFGDLHANGRDGVEFYTRKKVVTSRW